ncbi:MAG: hypothetical protein AAFQ74_15345 [Cyanobacteria bacterium J06623_4]
MKASSFFPWVSAGLLLLANIAFGSFLHSQDTASQLIWMLAVVYVVLECSVLSICWQPVRNFILKGFQSDVGYAVMVIAIASSAVVLVTWVQIFGYFLVMLAAALLLRIDLFTRRIGTAPSFISMLLISFLGMAISWLPLLLQSRPV